AYRSIRAYRHRRGGTPRPWHLIRHAVSPRTADGVSAPVRDTDRIERRPRSERDTHCASKERRRRRGDDMDEDILQDIFLSEVVRQSGFALMAAGDIDVALDAHDHSRLWYSVQAFLAAAGNLSKILWPTSRTSSERGQALRESLGV